MASSGRETTQASRTTAKNNVVPASPKVPCRDHWVYLEAFGVLVCREHDYAIRQLENHLGRLHHASAKDRR